jgi:hypothetical protein
VSGGDKRVNRKLEAKARTLAGWKSYITNITAPAPGFVIGAYHQLWHVEKSFRMSKHDLRARPIYHHKRGCEHPQDASDPKLFLDHTTSDKIHRWSAKCRRPVGT